MADKEFPCTFMERFCSDMPPNFGLETGCLNWFEQALDHCSALHTGAKKSYADIWSLLRSYIFADTQVLNAPVVNSADPNQLSIIQCNTLLLNIGQDYVARAPRYYMESYMNSLYTQYLFATLVFTTLMALVITGIVKYRYYIIPKPVPLKPVEKVYSSENRCLAAANRKLRRIKYELEQLKVHHMVHPEELLSLDGSKTLVMKTSSRISTIDDIVANKLFNRERLYRMYDLAHQKKPEYKRLTVPKIESFMDRYTRKLKIILLFDDIVDANAEDTCRHNSRSPQSHIPLPVFGVLPKRCGLRSASTPPPTSGSNQTTHNYQSTGSNVPTQGGESARFVNTEKKVKQSARLTSGIPRKIHRYTTTNKATPTRQKR